MRIYSLAKTIADLFKYRHKVGLHVAVEALRESIRSGKVKPGQIDPFAQICRVREVMRPYLEALVGLVSPTRAYGDRVEHPGRGNEHRVQAGVQTYGDGVAMTREELLSRITIDPKVCFGKPSIRGHRIWVSLILDLLASGMSSEEILDEYPGIEEADIRACIAYGAEMARERYVEVPLGDAH